MSATLTWFNSGLGAKTGTTNTALINDLVSLINATSPGASFSWQLASSSTAGPLYVVLKPKSGGVGRILIVIWASAPAGNNAAILDQSPVLSTAFIAFFPNGNVDTPSNLTASSGTIMGNDTGAVKCASLGLISNVYATNFQPFYFDSAEAVFFGFMSPASSFLYAGGAGYLLVDSADDAYAATLGAGNNSMSNFGGSSAPMPWVISALSSGSNSPGIKTNYGSSNRTYYMGLTPQGVWASSAVGSADILSDTTTNRVWYVPVTVLSNSVKGEGFALKLRQIAWGSGAVGAFQVYSTTGPVVQARQFNAATAGGNGYPWMTNFKL